MSSREPKNKVDEPRIFTPEVLSYLVEGTTKVELILPEDEDSLFTHKFSQYEIKRKERLTPEDITVYGSQRKGKPREHIIVPHYYGSQKKVRRTYLPKETKGDIVLTRKTMNLPNDLDGIRKCLDIPHADDDYVEKIHADLLTLPAHVTKISMSHDKREISLVSQHLVVGIDEKFPTKKVKVYYEKSRIDPVRLSKEYTTGKESFYLKAFIRSSRRDTPVFEWLSEDILFFKKLFAFFLDLPLEKVEEGYCKHSYPVVTKIFPNADLDTKRILSSIKGWLHEENNTLTKALECAIGGKPRKDFVRIFAKNINSYIESDKGEDDKELYYASIGSITLIRAARKGVFSSDIEGHVINILRDRKRNFSSLWFLRRFIEFSTSRQIETDFATDDEEIIIYLIAFLGESLFKRMLYDEPKPNEPEHGGFLSKPVLESIVYTIKERDPITHKILTRSFYHSEEQHMRAVKAIAEKVSAENDGFRETLEPYGWNHKMSLPELDEVMSFYYRIQEFNGGQVFELPRGEMLDTVEKISKEPLTIEGNTYAWTLPKNTKDILMWSEYLHNCMAIYVEEVMMEEYFLAFVEKNSKPYAALGLKIIHRDGKNLPDYLFDQLYELKNTPLPQVLEEKLRKQFKEACEQQNIEITGW